MHKKLRIGIALLASLIAAVVLIYRPFYLVISDHVPHYLIWGYVPGSGAGTIHSQAELEALLPDRWSENADKIEEIYGKLAKIDFDRHFIAKNYAGGSGCETKIFLPTLVKVDESTLRYNIDVTETGTCEPYVVREYNIAIPIKYKDHEIIFSQRVVASDLMDYDVNRYKTNRPHNP